MMANATENSDPARTTLRLAGNTVLRSRQSPRGSTTAVNASVVALVARVTLLLMQEAAMATTMCQADG